MNLFRRKDTFSEAPNRHSSLLSESASSDNHYQLIRYPLYNQQGQLTANALQMRDVTEQVRDEKNRSALLSSVSHDLRTPLTTIKAAVTGLLQEDVAWDEQDRREMLEDIDAETDHLTILVNALVEMSRIEMGALILEKEWCDVVEVVYGTLAKLAKVLAGHPMHVHALPHLPLIYVDHVQLERVCYNLIENAARHSPEQAEIVVTLDVVSNMLRVQVLDQGCGIPEGERERIFKSFYGLHSYGNGLGLAICKGIIEAHQGHIWVEAASDSGSCFIFTLPIYPHDGVYAEAVTSATTGVSGTNTAKIILELGRRAVVRGKGKRILVVDDEPPIQRILRRNLSMSGYEVFAADNGKEAMEIVRLRQPDLILLDLCLPGELNGLDVCVKVRESWQIPIIVLSAVTEERQKVRALDLGADDYLTKPFSTEELQARVRACLRRASSHGNDRRKRSRGFTERRWLPVYECCATCGTCGRARGTLNANRV